MDRRATLKKFFGVESAALSGMRLQEEALPVGGGLNPFSGTWNYAAAAHLLRRAMFGPSHAQIEKAVQDGLEKTLDLLFTPQAKPMPPVLYGDSPDDPDLKLGDSWVDKKLHPEVQALANFKENSLYSWLLQLIFNEGVSVTEKMTLFWHNHFVVSEIFDPRYSYDYITLLRENALGNFKELTKKITVDKAMLIYLNGAQNLKRAPNENYARELMELFTLGKGDLAGPGDYTTFTEQDVLALAKALTGWVIRTDRMDESFYPYVEFIPTQHDTSVKQLSHRFGGITIANANAKEYENVVDILFTKREAATFICKKLYRYFVYYKVSQDIQNQIIEGLADLLIANDFEIAPVVRTLLASDHFYTDEALGCLIRMPYEFVFNTIKTMGLNVPTDIPGKYNVFLDLYRSTAGMEQVYFNPPSVAGWTPYYQEPNYHEIWVNSVTLPIRNAFTTVLANKAKRIRNIQGILFGLDLIGYVEKFANPGNATALIDDVVNHLLPKAIEANQKAFLKAKLLGQRSEAQWTSDWNAYKANPSQATRTAVENRLKPLFVSLLSMPEYYLS
ncbi:MAG: DUF1800 domain-containing protein [Saprospiraceae bacterium]|nr:DUF1800 domain-containing protein [Saprospiraceae bacterium]